MKLPKASASHILGAIGAIYQPGLIRSGKGHEASAHGRRWRSEVTVGGGGKGGWAEGEGSPSLSPTSQLAARSLGKSQEEKV